MSDWAKQVGDIGKIMMWIVAMAMFTILLVAGNTMAQAIRERTNELAVLKTLGFGEGRILSLVLLESVCIAIVGGGLGLALSYAFITMSGDPTHGLLPAFYFPTPQTDRRHRPCRGAGAGVRISAGLAGEPAAHCRCAEEELVLSQIIAVTGVNIRSIPARLGSSTVAVIGIAGVVLVFVAVLSIAEGVNATMKASSDPNLVLILRAGSDTEMTSGLAGEAVRVIQDAPGIARDASGAPLTSPELFVVVDHPLKRGGSAANVPLRGVSPEAFQVHNRLKIVEGRNLEFGKNEIIAGRAAAQQFVNLNVGTTLKWGENTWTAGRNLRRRRERFPNQSYGAT